MENLKNCPFCLNKASKSIDPEMMLNHGCYMIECTYCHGRNLETDWNTRPSQWISVKDKPIPLNEAVLITNIKSVDITYITDYDGMLISDLWWQYEEYSPTHWMTLPLPPTETK